ncbi:MAG: hypothetical protein ACRDSH_09685 [Pseudonocardiaceae bacterium]
MTLEADLAAWAAKRPPWQQDFLARLCRQVPFDEVAIAEVADRLIADEQPETVDLTAADIPGSPVTSADVRLVALKDLTGVNGDFTCTATATSPRPSLPEPSPTGHAH